jgi:hypothetical protein
MAMSAPVNLPSSLRSAANFRFPEGFSMWAAARRLLLDRCRPTLTNLGRRKLRGLGWSYGESTDRRLTEPNFRRYSRGQWWRSKPCAAVISGSLTSCLGRLSVFCRAWHETTLSRNAAQIGADVDQFDGHFILLPTPLVGHDIGVSDHGGRSQ